MRLAHGGFFLNVSYGTHLCSKCPGVADLLRLLQRWRGLHAKFWVSLVGRPWGEGVPLRSANR